MHPATEACNQSCVTLFSPAMRVHNSRLLAMLTRPNTAGTLSMRRIEAQFEKLSSSQANLRKGSFEYRKNHSAGSPAK